ncbi:MAG: hypothetical protein NC402_03465 [Prevotella sp.]|nr:hypothetical protein [Prevotella sp.]MCM1074947.1 hypothetical protein [Ruminococcus sp.]
MAPLIFSILGILAGYGISWFSCKQCEEMFTGTMAASSFKTMKSLFKISIIFALVGLLLSFITYSTIAHMIQPRTIYDSSFRGSATGNAVGSAIFTGFFYFVYGVYTIAMVVLIYKKSEGLNENTNIKAMKTVKTGAMLGAGFFFLTIATVLICKLFDLSLSGVWMFLLFALAVWALAMWVYGWFSASSEVMQHDVEAKEFNDGQVSNMQ